jgi:F0F1-type ATP synthase membrane subunit b/b'
MNSAVTPVPAVGSGVVAIVLVVAFVLVALVVLGGMRQRQKRLTEGRADARQLRDEARERTDQAEGERYIARERAEQAEEIDPER